MAQEKFMTIQEIDEHIEKSEQLASSENLQAINICGIYATVRPVLVFAKSVLSFVKPKWATVIDTFISTVDVFCKPPVPPTTE